jgi:hypothetical protein
MHADQLHEVNQEAKELIREAHAVVKDLKAVIKEARDLFLGKDVEKIVHGVVADHMQALSEQIDRTTVIAEDAIFDRFDRLEKSLLTPALQTAIQEFLMEQAGGLGSREPLTMRQFRQIQP